MFKSLEILKNLPGNEERQSTCDSFKESLLSAVRPRLQRDVAGDDLTPLQEYFYVFQKLDRLDICVISSCGCVTNFLSLQGN